MRLVGQLLGLLERLLGLDLSVAEPEPGLGLFLLRIAFVFGHGKEDPRRRRSSDLWDAR
jgi:hypothetical protein